MKSCGIFLEYMVMAIAQEEDKQDCIQVLIDMIDRSLNYKTKYFRDDERIYNQEIDGLNFGTWLYDTSKSELKDIKKELSIKLERSSSLEEEIDIENLKSEQYIIGKNKSDYVWSEKDYYHFKQSRLELLTNVSEFAIELPECFSKLYFDDTVGSSLRTLGSQFNEIVEEIVLHLKKLDDYHDEFLNLLSSSSSFIKIALEFKKHSGIDCSPQAGRDGVKKLVRSFYNEKTKKTENLTCELHTKFSNTNCGKRKPDRLYFHPGHDGIHDSKVIIIHIGEHL